MNKVNFKPFPILTTERLTLRQLKIEDEIEMFALRTDERVNKFLDRPIAETIEDARKFICKINEGITKNEWIYWAITLKNNCKLIGIICFWKISTEHSKAEIGFELLPVYQRKGIMQEVLAITIEYGIEHMRLHAMEGYVAPNNSRSIKLLKKNGFVYDRKLKDTVIYSLKNHIEKK